MKKSLVFSIVFLISILANITKVNAQETCSRFYTDGLNSYILRDDNQILIEDVEFNATFSTYLIANKNYYWSYFYSNNLDYDVLLLYTVAQPSLKGTISNNIGSSNYGKFNLEVAYTYSSSWPVYEFRVGHDNTIKRVRKVLGTGSITLVNQYSPFDLWLNSWGTNNELVTELSVTNTSNNQTVKFSKNEENYCALPSKIPEPTFEANYTQYNDQNIAVNLTINFKDFDLEKYDYLLSFDEGKSYKNINTNIDDKGNYILTRLENFNVLAKVVDKSSEEFITSAYYADSLTTLDNFMVFYEDSTKNEYVTVDNKEYLYSKTIRMYPITQVENLQYRYTTDNEVYQYFSDVIEKKSFKNENITVEVVDKYYNVIKTFSYSVTGFESSAELGETIIFDEFIDSEDKEKIIVYLRILNANSSHNYYVKQENSSYKKVYPWNWQSGQYYFESTDTIKNYCARITNEKNELIKEECYTIKGFSTTKNFHSFMIKIKRFINNQKDTINSLSNAVDDFFLMIPDPIFNLLTFLYFLLCLGAIIWNVRR